MRSYHLDEISTPDMAKIREYLAEHAVRSPLADVFWLPISGELLTGIQEEHGDCQPYGVAVEVGDHFVRFELLIRSRVNHRCGCAQYAAPAQREFVTTFAETMIGSLGVRT
jgi:hypothetical protein